MSSNMPSTESAASACGVTLPPSSWAIIAFSPSGNRGRRSRTDLKIYPSTPSTRFRRRRAPSSRPRRSCSSIFFAEPTPNRIVTPPMFNVFTLGGLLNRHAGHVDDDRAHGRVFSLAPASTPRDICRRRSCQRRKSRKSPSKVHHLLLDHRICHQHAVTGHRREHRIERRR